MASSSSLINGIYWFPLGANWCTTMSYALCSSIRKHLHHMPCASWKACAGEKPVWKWHGVHLKNQRMQQRQEMYCMTIMSLVFTPTHLCQKTAEDTWHQSPKSQPQLCSSDRYSISRVSFLISFFVHVCYTFIQSEMKADNVQGRCSPSSHSHWCRSLSSGCNRILVWIGKQYRMKMKLHTAASQICIKT